ncbi:MAG TPA: hypothetical protein VHB72_04965 [Candidatus Saccharimonadales bacterium]|nr:hypothetical protein [Candidatus Saccharimonadales bacterium]
MSIWETGYCSRTDYETGKAFLVLPERLATEGIYGFVCRAKPSLAWEACRFIVRVEAVLPPQKDQESYLVGVGFEELGESGAFGETKQYHFNAEGFAHGLQEPYEEAYLRYFPDGTEDEFVRVHATASTPMAMGEVPNLVPAAR